MTDLLSRRLSPLDGVGKTEAPGVRTLTDQKVVHEIGSPLKIGSVTQKATYSGETGLGVSHHVCYWHFSDMPPAPSNVRYRG